MKYQRLKGTKRRKRVGRHRLSSIANFVIEREYAMPILDAASSTLGGFLMVIESILARLTRERTEIKRLEELDRIARRTIRNFKLVAGSEGFLTALPGGVIGWALLPPDMAITLILCLMLINKIAAIYGFNLNDKNERLFAIYILKVALAGNKNAINVDSMVKVVSRKGMVRYMPKEVVKKMIREVAKRVGVRIPGKAVSRIIPFTSGAFGFVINWRIVEDVGECAHMMYRRRFLKKFRGTEKRGKGRKKKYQVKDEEG